MKVALFIYLMLSMFSYSCRTFYLKGESVCEAKSWYWAIKNKQVNAFIIIDAFSICIFCKACIE